MELSPYYELEAFTNLTINQGGNLTYNSTWGALYNMTSIGGFSSIQVYQMMRSLFSTKTTEYWFLWCLAAGMAGTPNAPSEQLLQNFFNTQYTISAADLTTVSTFLHANASLASLGTLSGTYSMGTIWTTLQTGGWSAVAAPEDLAKTAWQTQWKSIVRKFGQQFLYPLTKYHRYIRCCPADAGVTCDDWEASYSNIHCLAKTAGFMPSYVGVDKTDYSSYTAPPSAWPTAAPTAPTTAPTPYPTAPTKFPTTRPSKVRARSEAETRKE